MTLVVDASVAMKWFVAEPGSAAALNLLTSGEDLIAPDVIIAELCNAAWRLWRQGEMTGEQLGIMAGRAPQMFAERRPSDALSSRASRIAIDLDHPVYDCFYLALAEQEDARMVTADRRLLARMGGTPWENSALGLETFA